MTAVAMASGTSITSHMVAYDCTSEPVMGSSATITFPPITGPRSMPQSIPVNEVLLAAPRRSTGTDDSASDWMSGAHAPKPAEPTTATTIKRAKSSTVNKSTYDAAKQTTPMSSTRSAPHRSASVPNRGRVAIKQAAYTVKYKPMFSMPRKEPYSTRYDAVHENEMASNASTKALLTASRANMRLSLNW